jgi:putative SOS response-associated peptidase YedK
MCGRYALHANPEVIALQFGLDARPEFKPSYNVCPGTDILAVRNDRSGRRRAGPLRWGAGNKLVNARAETLGERPAFRNAFRQFRCLIPASGFYEWQAAGRSKRPWYVLPRDAPLFGLAGIVLLWQGVRSVAIVTTDANELMAPVHDRMPVIVDPADYAAWLDAGDPRAEKLLGAYPAEPMQAYPVSSRVNAPANDDPLLLERAPDLAV